MQTINFLSELDIICQLPVTAKTLHKQHYKDHLDCHKQYERTTREKAVKERNFFFYFKVEEKQCVIYQAQAMGCSYEWITREGKSTASAIKKAVIEFHKRFGR